MNIHLKTYNSFHFKKQSTNNVRWTKYVSYKLFKLCSSITFYVWLLYLSFFCLQLFYLRIFKLKLFFLPLLFLTLFFFHLHDHCKTIHNRTTKKNSFLSTKKVLHGSKNGRKRSDDDRKQLEERSVSKKENNRMDTNFNNNNR